MNLWPLDTFEVCALSSFRGSVEEWFVIQKIRTCAKELFWQNHSWEYYGKQLSGYKAGDKGKIRDLLYR